MPRFNEVKTNKVYGATSATYDSDTELQVAIEPPCQYPFVILLNTFTRAEVDALKKKARDIVDRKEIKEGFSDKQLIVKR